MGTVGTSHTFKQRNEHIECVKCGTRSHWPAAKEKCSSATPYREKARPVKKAVERKPEPLVEPPSGEYSIGVQLFEGTFAKQALQRVIYLESEAVIRAAIATALRGIEPEYAMEVYSACEWYYKRAEEPAQDKCRKLLKSLRLLLAANMSLAV